jgi:predicted ribosome quality control (RQC) complex YloA/Tae2 family protein
MKYGTRIRYNELEQFVFQFKKEISGTFLKNIYHYEGKWLFKFSTIEFVYDYSSLWLGSFQERENKNLHSICIKLRKELGQKKCFHVNLLENDRVVCFDFGEYSILLEFYAKGNLLLIENTTNKIVVLTRCYENFRNNCVYPMKSFVDFPPEYSLQKCDWKKDEKTIDFCENGLIDNILDASQKIWKQNYNVQSTKKTKKEKRTPLQNIQNQVSKLSKRLEKQEEEIKDYYQKNGVSIDYKEVERLEKDRKLLKKKLQGAKEYLDRITSEKVIKTKKVTYGEKIELVHDRWYHSYYWWRTKNNFLVVGGKSATDNEILVKNYLKDEDYYFHTEDMGSGSFILMSEGKVPDVIDLVETSEGVFALSKYWNETKTGKVFYVKGDQVSKTPPTGMSLSKGSFMIYGKKEFISVHQTILGYVVTEKKELMLAPYRIIERYMGKKIKLLPKPNVKKMKGKQLMEKLQNGLGIVPKSIPSIFSKPCSISVI